MARVRRGLGNLGWALLTLMMAAWVAIPLSALALDAVLVISGLTTNDPGGSSENGIPIQSLSWGADREWDLHQPTPPVGTPNIRDLRVVKATDGTSPELLYHTLVGTTFTDATLYVGATSSKAGGPPITYDFSIEMTAVGIADVELSGGLNDPTETVVLHFREVRVEDDATGNAFNWNQLQGKGNLE